MSGMTKVKTIMKAIAILLCQHIIDMAHSCQHVFCHCTLVANIVTVKECETE